MKNGSARDEVLLCGGHRCSVHNCKIICKRVSEITSFLVTDSIPTTEKGISHDYKRQCFNSSIYAPWVSALCSAIINLKERTSLLRTTGNLKSVMKNLRNT